MAEKRIEDQNGKIVRICMYHKYWLDGATNPLVDSDSRKIMDIKNPRCRGYEEAIVDLGRRFVSGTFKYFDEGDAFQVAIVPSSSAGLHSAAVERIMEYASEHFDVRFDPCFLVRISSITPVHSGGDRSIENHLNTIEVQADVDQELPMLILDDVTTSGNSFRACEILMREAGVSNVFMIAMGMTANET
jgi:hypothetical protein